MAQDRLHLGLLMWVGLLFYVIVKFQVNFNSQHIFFLFLFFFSTTGTPIFSLNNTLHF